MYRNKRQSLLWYTAAAQPGSRSIANHRVDETVDLLLALEAPYMEKEALTAHFARLAITVEAYAVNSQGRTRDTPSSELVFAGAVPDVAHPLVVPGKDSGDERTVYALWKLPITLIRPRMRTQGPSIIFSASAALKPALTAELHSTTGGYLVSGQPSSVNLLESFGDDPHLNGVKPRLSSLRVSRITPVTRGQDAAARLRAMPQLQLPIHAIVHSRVRFSRPHTSPPSSTLLGQLEFDFTPDFDCEVLLDKIELKSSAAVVESLNTDAALQLPLSCVAHDHITLLYEIKQHKFDIAPKDTTGMLDITVSVKALIDEACTPLINMKWTAMLDFISPINPAIGTATDGGVHRSHRPAQLSLSSAQTAVMPLMSPSVTMPDSLPGLEATTARVEATLPDLGITMSFAAPEEPVFPGDIFTWTVYILNRATEKSTRPPRKLALVPVPKRRRHESRPVRPPSTASRREGEKEVADAAVDENVIHAMQRNALVDGAEMVSLNPDTRVGPLGPGACHAVELQFLALKAGIAEMEAIRVVDMASQEHVDIQGLPVTIIGPAAA